MFENIKKVLALLGDKNVVFVLGSETAYLNNKQEAYKLLKDNKLVHRVVPNSYGWKYNTECFLTDEFMKHFPAILKSVIAEAVAERNLKEAPKKAEKKVAKA